MIKALFAVDEKDGLGKDGTLPWPHDRNDMLRFKALTTDHVVVMGSRSWDDPHTKKPLPSRINVVLTSKVDGNDWADMVVHTIEDTIALQETFPDKNIWICGGATVLQQFTNHVDEVYITRFKGDYGCDTFLSVDSFLEGYERRSVEHDDNKDYEIWA